MSSLGSPGPGAVCQWPGQGPGQGQALPGREEGGPPAGGQAAPDWPGDQEQVARIPHSGQVEVDARHPLGWTALHLAAVSGHPEVTLMSCRTTNRA